MTKDLSEKSVLLDTCQATLTEILQEKLFCAGNIVVISNALHQS